jgi:hypothetical protein
MAGHAVHRCQCPGCLSGRDHPDRQQHRQINLLLSRLGEQRRRWLAALESTKAGYGGDALLALVTGLHGATIRRGREELDADLRGRPTDRVRRPGAGRPPREKKTRPSSTT